MNVTTILKNEHRVIEQVLVCLERIARDAATNQKLDGAAAKDAIAFFRNFADKCHHGKEEVHLFPALEDRGMPKQGGPLGVMLDEHTQGRSHVRAMDDAIDDAANGDSAAIQQFARHAQAYILLLGQHIHKEDHCLFAMADGLLSEADQLALLNTFEHVERDEMGEGTHEKFHAIADQLAEKYGVTKAEVVSEGGHAPFTCSHHQKPAPAETN
ncbi:MAG: hemerythrin domain-containing protein [Candidatus Hydrogenedentes bacterium]|nr:hemerythrin domain-containing protein [Candidatus Hydrogenedentota bacterium]